MFRFVQHKLSGLTILQSGELPIRIFPNGDLSYCSCNVPLLSTSPLAVSGRALASAEEAAAVFREGDTQTVANTIIVVQKFMRNVAPVAKENGPGQVYEHMIAQGVTVDEYWDRVHRAQTTESLPACDFWPPQIRLEL